MARVVTRDVTQRRDARGDDARNRISKKDATGDARSRGERRVETRDERLDESHDERRGQTHSEIAKRTHCAPWVGRIDLAVRGARVEIAQ